VGGETNKSSGGGRLGVPQTLVVVIDVTHNEGVALSLEGHSVPAVHTGFENPRRAPHRMTAQSGMPEV